MRTGGKLYLVRQRVFSEMQGNKGLFISFAFTWLYQLNASWPKKEFRLFQIHIVLSAFSQCLHAPPFCFTPLPLIFVPLTVCGLVALL